MRLGLRREDAEDCAMEFVLRLLRLPPPETYSSAWLHRCAYNHACNYVRTLRRRRQREVCSAAQSESQADQLHAYPASNPGPKTLTLRKELWRQLAKALEQLSPSQRELFVRYHLRHQNISQLAARFQRTPHAIEVSLSHTRQRLATLLRQVGWTEADARTLFRSGPASAGPRR
jgi:RNA polymerase sigma factor (sigma-70 family)